MFVDFNILNQLGSPSINSNTFANRPAAGQIGRLFVSTDTFEIYRDNGTTWDLIGGPGSSTITGTGTATQVAFFTSSQAIGSNVNLYWDNVNERLGIGTTTPSSKLDIAGSNTLLHLKGGSNAYMMFHGNGIDEYKVGYTDGPVDYRRYSIYDESGAKEVLTIDKQSRYVGINYQYSSLVDQPAYTLDVEGSGRFTNSAYFVSSGSGQVGINTLAPTATALMQVDKTDGYGLYLNYTTNAGTGSSATALWSLNTTNGSGYSAVIEEKTPNTTAGQYPLLVKHSLSAGTAGVGMGTGVHFQLPDNAGTFRTTQLTIETTDVAAATYTSRYRFMAQVGGTSTALAYLTSTGLGINGIPTRALELFTNTSTQTAALVLNNAATTPKGYLGTYTNNLYITQGGTFNTSWAADGTNAISAIILGANNNSSTILFQTTNANNSTPLTRMYISEAGSVGIGTTGPLYTLDVNGTIASTTTSTNPAYRAVLPANANAEILFSYSNTAFGWKLVQDEAVTGDLKIVSRAVNVDTTRIYIRRSDGNVGINDNNPTSNKLSVKAAHVSGNGIIGIYPVGNDVATLALYDQAGARQALFYGDTNFIAVETESKQLLFSTVGQVRQTITTGGNVLIGTTTDAGYKTDVAGTIRNTTSSYFNTTSGATHIGVTTGATASVPNGKASLIHSSSGTIFSYTGSMPNPYSQNIQIDIAYTNWGGNNVIGVVDLIVALREWNNTSGTAFGKVFATTTGAAATFSTFNTTDITTSQCTLAAASGGNYTLRITIDPSNNTDIYSIYMNVIEGGIGVSISSITVTLV